jgi:hypothetical protein
MKQPKATQAQSTNVWYDTQLIIKKFVDALPEESNDRLVLPAEILKEKIEQEFKGKHNADEVLQLLKNGFEVTPGIYHFKIKDFKIVNPPVAYNSKTPKLWKPAL